MPDLKPSSFSTAPDNVVPVVDVYETLTASPVNAVEKTIKAGVDDAVKAATETFSIENLQDLGNDYLNGEFDKKKALGKISEATNNALSKLTITADVKASLVTDLLKSVGFSEEPTAIVKGALGLPGGTDPTAALLNKNPRVKFIYDTVTVTRNNADLDSAKGIADLMNSITGNSELAKVLDLESTFAVMKTVLNKASELDIPGIIDSVLDRFEAQEDKENFLLEAAEQMARNGDLAGLAKVVDVAGRHRLLAKVPKVCLLLLQNYHLPIGVRAPTTTERDALLSVLSDIDPHWYQYNRNGVWINDLSAYQDITLDAKHTLSLSAAHEIDILLAPHYPEEEFHLLAKRNYPYIGF